MRYSVPRAPELRGSRHLASLARLPRDDDGRGMPKEIKETRLAYTVGERRGIEGVGGVLCVEETLTRRLSASLNLALVNLVCCIVAVLLLFRTTGSPVSASTAMPMETRRFFAGEGASLLDLTLSRTRGNMFVRFRFDLAVYEKSNRKLRDRGRF